MSSMTIDFGIDLGTTNSAISAMNAAQVETLDIDGSKTMPSCVFIDRKGNTHLGNGALPRLLAKESVRDVQTEFKRVMGHDKVKYLFESSGEEHTPVTLSSKILAKLRSTVVTRFATDPPPAIVITIPAIFDAAAINATSEAGKLAGFEHVELLQEPVAAAITARENSGSDKAFWLIFDFGGGTFDASIVNFRDDQMSVTEHGGDMYLGGSDLDKAVVQKIIIPQISKEHDVSHLSAANAKDDGSIESQLHKIKFVAERVKKELSEKEEVVVLEDNFLTDVDGNSIDLDLTVTRDQFNSVIEGLVDRSIKEAKEVINAANLKPSDIEKVVLVGGTTFVPLVREKVSELNIPIDCSCNPMTMVSRGAAIYAATKRMPDAISQKNAPKTGLSLKLQYPTSSKQKEVIVMGKISVADGSDLESGLDVSINRADAEGKPVWNTGSLSYDQSGFFQVDLRLEQDLELAANQFSVIAKDSTGAPIEINPSAFNILVDTDEIAGAILPASRRVGLADNSTVVLVQKGTQLPYKSSKTAKLKTVHALKANSEETLRIPFVEGEQKLADRNLEGGEILIRGTDIDFDLPVNSDIEIKVAIDESVVMHAECFVEALDETFECTASNTDFDSKTYRSQLKRVLNQTSEIEDKLHALEDDSIAEQLDAISADERADEIEQAITDGDEGGDVSSLGTARSQLIALQNDLDEVQLMVNWPSILAEYEEERGQVRKKVQKNGRDEDKQALKDIEEQANQAIEEKDGKMLTMATEALGIIDHALRWRDPVYLTSLLGELAKMVHLLPNKTKADALISQGGRAAEVGDVDTLASVVGQLIEMIPRDAVNAGEIADTDFISGVI